MVTESEPEDMDKLKRLIFETGMLHPHAAELAKLTAELAALDKLMEAKFVTFRVLIDSQAEKVALALASADKAVTKAEIATEKRFESVNEFRTTLSDQAANFVTRTEYLAKVESQIDRVGDLTTRLDKIEGASKGLQAGWGWIVGAVGMAVPVIAVIVAYFNRIPG